MVALPDFAAEIGQSVLLPMNPLSLIPTTWAWPAAGLAALALVGALGVQTVRIDHLKRDIAELQAAWLKDREQASVAARKAEAAARATEQAWLKRQKDLDDANDLKLQALRADIAIRDAAAGRLQQRVAAYVAAARAAAEGAAPEQGGPPATDTAGVLADLLGRCVARVQQLATVADERGAAGSLCEGEHDAVAPP
jgi:hypothetical protein